jgi:predicted ABC-type ATPase
MTEILSKPRLRIFAGPNGSGKSTIKSFLAPKLTGIYINPDDIEKEILTSSMFDFSPFAVQTNKQDILTFFKNSTLIQKFNLESSVDFLKFNDNKLDFSVISVNSYWASAIADFIRQNLLTYRRSFTFETVMSSKDKIELLQKAQQLGYRTYLYYVATQDTDINISRVNLRVLQGGHNVSSDKIIQRYYRSLDLLREAIKFSNRSYIFDNSGYQLLWLAEITDGKAIEIKTEFIPVWFDKYVLNKLAYLK